MNKLIEKIIKRDEIKAQFHKSYQYIFFVMDFITS